MLIPRVEGAKMVLNVTNTNTSTQYNSCGAGSEAPDRDIIFLFNNTETIVPAHLAVSSVNGELQLTDVSSEDSAMAVVGLTNSDTPEGAMASVLTAGISSNVPLLGTIDDSLYVSKTPGVLTTTYPSVGQNDFVAGDFIIYIGKILKNPTIDGAKDILISIEIVGQL